MTLLSTVLFFSCSYYFPSLELKEVALPKAEHGFEMNTNSFIQEPNVSANKLDYWTDKHCMIRYEPERENIKEKKRRELPPRFFLPLVISVKKESLWIGDTEIEEEDWTSKNIDDLELLNELYDVTTRAITTYQNFVRECSHLYQLTIRCLLRRSRCFTVSQESCV